jgi:predicted phosphodiesterase
MAKEKPQLDEQMKEIVRLIRLHNKPGSTGTLRDSVAESLGVTVWKARKLITQAETMMAGIPQVGIDPSDPLFRSEIARRIKKATTVPKIATSMHSSEDDVNSVLEDMEERGYIIMRRGNTVQLGRSAEQTTSGIILKNHLHTEPISFGIVADMHMCSKSERLDVLQAAYDTFEERGINTVFCPGNYLDGECRFNTHELFAHGIADQVQYAIDHWPQKSGIKTYYVDGDDHEGWYQKREGIEIGRYLMLEANAQGRDDLVYMGYMEADFELQAPEGKAIIKVIHAGGGSSYAYSYASQKLVESFQGGEKPAVCIIGHYHKAEYCFPRNVHCVQAGCMQDQTRFMRKKKLAAHVGFVIVTLQQDIRGSITRFCPEFFPFWDRGFYINRDGIGKRLQGK